jgi:hypothetical protein
MSSSEQQALASVVASGFAVDRLRALGWASLNASALPAAALWLAAGIHLSPTLLWLALVTWPACAALAAASLALASRFRRSYEAGQPATRGLARVHFTAGAPSAAATLSLLAAVLGAELWLAAVVPALMPPEALVAVRVAWPTLVAATVAARARELAA